MIFYISYVFCIMSRFWKGSIEGSSDLKAYPKAIR